MSYLLLIVEPLGQRAERPEGEGAQAYRRMLDYTADLKARGVLLGSNSLTSSEHGVRVQRREGRQALLDGPFAEAKEMVGGYFLLDCATREEAIALAAECPAAEWCTVEVRETGPCFE
ncbi:dehydrogenase [Chitinimonas arctica]|uniref:Dehydrogenase n=1 Tax=Chitinimonas arctica TaxID=2594795 RepID=A0A516SGQ6_9NEIS|nr:YciI family protein [Chitinimonas arctica]QDQ27347.1 dehydrogenase [Chitinimonas arctica]